MKISIQRIIDISLIIIFYAGFQGGKYFLNNRVQELGFAVTIGLFLLGAIRLAYTMKASLWRLWFWTAPMIIIYLMLSASLSFAFIAQVDILPSLFNSREFIILLLAPTLYFIYKLGYSLERLEKIFFISLIIIVFNYLFHYFRIDLVSAYFSTGYTSYLVVYDDWRGYRLKPPLMALVIISFYTLIRLFQQDKLINKIGLILLFCVIAYVWFLLKARSQMVTMALAILIYPLFFSRPKRISLFILAAPIVFIVVISIAELLVDKLMYAEGAEVRAKSYITATNNIKKYPLFGHGNSSAYSKTYQDIFGKKFFPSDLGLIGVTFKYGFIGLILYLSFNVYLFRQLMRLNWYYRYIHNRHNPLVWALFILLVAVSINVLLNPVLIMMQGLTTGAFVVGLVACYKEEYLNVLLKK